MEPQRPEHPPEGIKTLYNLYGLYAATIVVSILPFMSAALLSIVFFIVLLISAYSVRKKSEDDSLAYNHADFIIRTLWISALFSLITMALASVYMLGGIDYSAFEPCATSIASQDMEHLERMGTAALYAQAEPCVEAFIASNKTLMINAVVIAGLPVVLYMAYRLIKGVKRVREGYRIAHPKSWF